MDSASAASLPYGLEHAAAPPWILGHRGTPLEAPENTLASLRRALDIGLDGFEYDVRACASGEAVLIHDERLERTTDGTGTVLSKSLPELFGIDAGGWFARRFVGEPLPLLDEALELKGDEGREPPLHMIEIKERGLVSEVAQKTSSLAPGLPVRVASFLRDVVLEARDQGLPTMLLGVRALEEDRRFVRDEHLDAYGTGPGGWRSEAGARDWSFCERWSWSVDEPADLLQACRTPLFGFNTNTPYRALATRALVRLAADDTGDYPVEAPLLLVAPESLGAGDRARGEWYGSWRTRGRVRNPFPFPVEARAHVFVQNGAFEIEGLPRHLALGPGQSSELEFTLIGGSRSPGGDPLLAVLYSWTEGPGGAGSLLLDAPMRRVRQLVADALPRRVELLAERPGEPSATMTVRRRGGRLFVAIEHAGDLEDPHVVVHLAGETVRGGRGLRLPLPADFDQSSEGAAFSCGIEGRRDGRRVIRRWAGGLPEGTGHGDPGRLLPLRGA